MATESIIKEFSRIHSRLIICVATYIFKIFIVSVKKGKKLWYKKLLHFRIIFRCFRLHCIATLKFSKFYYQSCSWKKKNAFHRFYHISNILCSDFISKMGFPFYLHCYIIYTCRYPILIYCNLAQVKPASRSYA